MKLDNLISSKIQLPTASIKEKNLTVSRELLLCQIVKTNLHQLSLSNKE